jgi:hypothetical protein
MKARDKQWVVSTTRVCRLNRGMLLIRGLLNNASDTTEVVG